MVFFMSVSFFQLITYTSKYTPVPLNILSALNSWVVVFSWLLHDISEIKMDSLHFSIFNNYNNIEAQQERQSLLCRNTEHTLRKCLNNANYIVALSLTCTLKCLYTACFIAGALYHDFSVSLTATLFNGEWNISCIAMHESEWAIYGNDTRKVTTLPT